MLVVVERLTKEFPDALSQVLEFACDASFMQGMAGPAATAEGRNLSPT